MDRRRFLLMSLVTACAAPLAGEALERASWWN
jgi:hypothetical protein